MGVHIGNDGRLDYPVAQSRLRGEVGGKCSAETGCACQRPYTGTGQSLLIVFKFLIAQYLCSDSQNSWLFDFWTRFLRKIVYFRVISSALQIIINPLNSANRLL